jgi:hypothetical protein
LSMRFFRDICVTLGAIVLTITLFELGLRAAGAKYESSLYESDPVLYMALRPGAEGWQAKEGENYVTINHWGMRDGEHGLSPAPGTLRIALLGDSMIAAEQVPLEKTMAKLLESRLQNQVGTATHSIEVLNFAVGGYTLAQEYLLLQTRVWNFHPNIVILFLSPSSVPSCDKRLYAANIPFFVMRDGQLVPDPANHPPAASSPSGQRWHAFWGNLMNHIRVFQVVRKATQDGIPREIAKLKGGKKSRNDNILTMWLRPPSSPAQENAWQIAGELLARMAQDSRDRSATFWVSAIGPEIEENPNPEVRAQFLRAHGLKNFDYAEQRLHTIATANNIQFISMESQLTEYAEQNHVSLRGFFNTRPNYGHWNENGNAAAAAVVADDLLQRGAALNLPSQSTQGKIAANRGGS